MFNVDAPGFPLALLAILIALRLVMYVAARVLGRESAPASTALTPDEPVDLAAVVLRGGDIPLAEIMTPPVPAERETPASRLLTELVDSGIIAVVLVFFIIRPFILQAFFIPSGSMIPTLRVGDKLLATKYEYHLRQPRRGEVIVFHAPQRALEMLGQTYDSRHPVEYVKRVVGVPGDRIRIVRDVGVFVNEERLAEPNIPDLPNYDFPLRDGDLASGNPAVVRQLTPHLRDGELIVPDGYLFVLGDNRTQSHDGHIWGLLERRRVIGKAIFIFWPFDRMGFIH